MNQKGHIQAAFDQAASSYDAAAILQREVVSRLLERLAIIRLDANKVLDAGSGTGFASPLLQQRFPTAQIIELDLAPGMLRQARARQPAGLGRLMGKIRGTRFPMQICADIEALPLADSSVDFIWSSLAMQWCTNPTLFFTEAMRVLRPGGLLLFSSLGPDTLKELRLAFAQADSHAHVNRFQDMHDLGDALAHSGFAAPVMEMEMLTMTYSKVREILADLKGIGAHSLQGERRPGLMGKTAWQKMEAAYETLRHDGLLPCSYEVLYGHAWKPQTLAAPHPQAGKTSPITFHARNKTPSP